MTKHTPTKKIHPITKEIWNTIHHSFELVSNEHEHRDCCNCESLQTSLDMIIKNHLVVQNKQLERKYKKLKLNHDSILSQLSDADRVIELMKKYI